jgi:hypothetical protein
MHKLLKEKKFALIEPMNSQIEMFFAKLFGITMLYSKRITSLAGIIAIIIGLAITPVSLAQSAVENEKTDKHVNKPEVGKKYLLYNNGPFGIMSCESKAYLGQNQPDARNKKPSN